MADRILPYGVLGRFFAAAICLCLTLSGCGKNTPTPPPAQPNAKNTEPSSAAAPEPNGTATVANPGNDTQPRRQNELWKDSSGREYLGDVPLDVFYDQPLTVASNATPLAGSDVAASNPANANSGQMTPVATNDGQVPMPAGNEAPSAATNGAGGWEDTLPMEVLDREVTTIRNFLNGKLQAVGTYNSAMLMIPPKAAAVAVLSQIASEHPGDLAWKEDAAYVRDLAKRMNEKAPQRGKKDQSRLLELFENMTDTFNRSRPAGLEEPPADDSFSDVAEMGLIMKRMEEAEQRMKTEAGSESAFQSKKEMIQHEAAILATLTKIIAREEYGYSSDDEDDEFTGYANKVIEAAKSIRNATDANDFSTYELSLSNISTSCQACHSVFKNN